jgi:TRAP transporter TAXI family solute receptor
MAADEFALLTRRERFRTIAIVVVLVIGALAVSVEWLRSAPPRRIVMASGPEFGVYHQHALRYQKILAREGVRIDERMTDGAQENLKLLLDPKSGVDVAFMQGGVATFPAADGLVMLASLYYEPIWVFYRGTEVLTQIKQLQGRRIAIGVPGSGTHALASRILDINGMTLSAGVGRGNTDIVAIGGTAALAALKAGEVDAVIFVGGAQTPTIQNAMREPSAKLLSVARADAYPRRYSFLTKLVLPPGTVDLALDVPDREVALIGTKAMLAAREDFHPALINLLIEAAREIHGDQGYFEAAGEFPGITAVDMRVSPHADQHKRFGPSLLYQYMPFWAATYVEKAIILLLPLVVVLVPLMNFLPQILRWRARSRIYRWYGQLALLERELAIHQNGERTGKWLEELERIDRAVGRAKTPAKFASEAYTLRDHIGIVRRAVLARTGAREGTARPMSGIDSPDT